MIFHKRWLWLFRLAARLFSYTPVRFENVRIGQDTSTYLEIVNGQKTHP